MSDRDIEALQAVYEAWGQGDFSASAELFDPAVVLVMRPEFPDAGTYRGLDEVRDYTRGFLEPWNHLTIEAEELAPAGQAILVPVRQHGVGRGSGVATELRYFHLWSFRNGRAARLEVFRDRAQALEAAGLLE